MSPESHHRHTIGDARQMMKARLKTGEASSPMEAMQVGVRSACTALHRGRLMWSAVPCCSE